MLTRDISFSIDKRKKVSDAIDSIKVLDPAVGSGHFLVSVLNELIAIKASLRVLFDTDGKLLNDISCTVANDELIIQDIYGNNYSYDANQPTSLRIQKALFEQKKNIIENCLYGVDLNPNSVNICRLRLWIELLKNAYYSENEDGQRNLTTLPNIDINIKVGDSLIHRFALDDKFDLRTKNFKDYITLVRKYKNTSNKSVKSEINQKINRIKDTFVNSFKSPEAEALDKAMAELTAASGTDLFGNGFDPKRYAELKKKADKAKEAFENRKGDPFYNNSLEWRMEFPEVLDNKGNFVGFDIVIANPPYIFARNKSFDDKTKQYYLSNYEVDEYQANTYTLFMELGYKLLRKNGTFAYIVPNNMLTIQSNQKIRNFLLNKSGSLVIINSLDKIFADANVDNCLVFLKKEKSDDVTVGELEKGDFNTIGTVRKDFFGKNNPLISISMVKYRDANKAYWKINNSNLKIDDVANIKTGIKAYQVGKGNPPQTREDKDSRFLHSKEKINELYVPYVDGNNVKRYELTWNGEYIEYSDRLAEPRRSTDFSIPRILVRQIPSKSVYSIDGVYVNTKIINDLNSMVIEDIKGINPLTLLGFLNSKPLTLWFLIRFDKFQRRLFPQFKVNELSQFPLAKIDLDLQNKIAYLVKNIMDKAERGEDYSKENTEVDNLVMIAFDFSDDEKESIRKFEF